MSSPKPLPRKTLDIEQTSSLAIYLKERGLIRPDESPEFKVLQGGVSNRTVMVDRNNGGSLVVKQALEQLRVRVEWRSDPRRIEKEGLGLQWLSRLAPPGSTTGFRFLDPTHHILGMDAVPAPHENWKVRLLRGEIHVPEFEQFGVLLGTVHLRSYQERVHCAQVFEDRTFFENLRLEPFYRYVAGRIEAASGFLADLIRDTETNRAALVHGDYSPKNILLYQGQLILLDHEVIHFGDPAFDIGFSMAHLLSKAHHLAARRSEFQKAIAGYWQSYLTVAGEISQTAQFASRAARHTIACLLARVEGRSPVDYLTVNEAAHQREVSLELMQRSPTNVETTVADFLRAL